MKKKQTFEFKLHEKLYLIYPTMKVLDISFCKEHGIVKKNSCSVNNYWSQSQVAEDVCFSFMTVCLSDTVLEEHALLADSKIVL